MKRREHFVFVESNTTGTGALAVRRLLERGDRVSFLARDAGKYPFLADPAPRLAVVPLETNDLEAVAARVEELRHEQGVDALLTFSEFYVPIVAEVARRIGTRYLSPEAARTCRSKPATREALRAAGRPVPAFRVVTSEEEARQAAGEISFPCVVKPPAGSSSKGVLRVESREELLEHFLRLHEWRANDRGQELNGEVLVESLLTGPEVSVESMTLAPGETVIVGITAKHLSPPPLFVEVGHDFPALLAPDEAAQVEAEVRAALDAVRFDFGPAHTELRLTPEGPVVVEINPRMAGGMIPELVRYANGVDLLGAFLAMLCGRPVDLTPVRAEHASIRFVLAGRAGRLGEVSGLEEARSLESVRNIWIGKRKGAPVRPAEEAADRVGHVIASGPSRARVLEAAAGALEKISLELIDEKRKAGPLKKYVLVIPDGASDVQRTAGRSPLADADTPHFDWLAAHGVCGLMQTLYEDLPRGSIVAQLGMLGWDPYAYSCHGRSVWELLGMGNVPLGADDLVFRANFVCMDGRRLVSYNAGFIHSAEARPLIERLNAGLRDEFPLLELHHNSDFRNSLVVRGAGLDPALISAPEPHEHEGKNFDISQLIAGNDPASEALADQLNCYLVRVGEILAGERGNMVFPWSAGRAFSVPSFRKNTGFAGRAAIVGCMDFLHGIAKVGDIEFYKVGNGRPDTDYAAKGAEVIKLLEDGYSFVICHVNSPDEAAHMHDRDLKIRCIEEIDRHVLSPIVEYFRSRPDELGGVFVAPDHYTNLLIDGVRAEAHSIDPVPFILWNGREQDEVTVFNEDSVRQGRYGMPPVSHLDLLRLLGLTAGLRPLPEGVGRQAPAACAIV